MKNRASFQRIDATAARKLLIRSDIAVLDTRDATSFQNAHIGRARRFTDRDLFAILTKTPKNTAILIYCYHGRTSQTYAQTFADFGFREVYSLDGGYEGWRQAETALSALGEALRPWLTEQGFPPDGINSAADNGMTALMKACRLGQAAIAAALLEAGARLDARNADGNNALWFACVSGDLDAVALLIDAGIDIDNRNDNGATCLMYAASTGKAAIVEKLLAAGADRRPETLDGFTALDMAATIDCLHLLRRAERRSRETA